MNYESILRRLRSKIFDYPEHLENKASRVLLKVKQRVLQTRSIPKRSPGPYSGAVKFGSLSVKHLAQPIDNKALQALREIRAQHAATFKRLGA